MYSRVGVDSECKMKMKEKISFSHYVYPCSHKSFGSTLQLVIHTCEIKELICSSSHYTLQTLSGDAGVVERGVGCKV